MDLLAAIELRFPDGSPGTEAALRVMQLMLERGFIVLCDGPDANIVTFTPPLTITERHLDRPIAGLRDILDRDIG